MNAIQPMTPVVLAHRGCARAPEAGRRVVYDCARGESVVVVYETAPGVAVLERGGRRTTPEQAPVVRDFAGRASAGAIRGTGGERLLEFGRMLPDRCRAG